MSKRKYQLPEASDIDAIIAAASMRPETAEAAAGCAGADADADSGRPPSANRGGNEKITLKRKVRRQTTGKPLKPLLTSFPATANYWKSRFVAAKAMPPLSTS
ncbi:hypothetical protein [Eikenella sp. NML99-0057]|uniref:hypothetical protein n=1 Tax=Eikenella sp. NML99-0057 TaxID=1795834 RepID=UPI0018D374B1|nr:hypothetical protein [Eikenella sp. NML99-0057]